MADDHICVNKTSIEILTQGYTALVKNIESMREDISEIRIGQVEIREAVKIVADHETRLRRVEEHTIATEAVATKWEAWAGILVGIIALILSLATIVVTIVK